MVRSVCHPPFAKSREGWGTHCVVCHRKAGPPATRGVKGEGPWCDQSAARPSQKAAKDGAPTVWFAIGRLGHPPRRKGADTVISSATWCKCRLRQDDDFFHHSQLIVQHAYIRVSAGSSEGHAEAGRAQWGLCQTGTILRRLGNESGMHSVGGRTDVGVPPAIRIQGHVGRGRNLVE